MIGSSLEYLKMVFHKLFKMIIYLRFQQTTESYLQPIGSHVLQREDTVWCQEFACKKIFHERMQLG
jgi:hypothetical protein